MNLQKSFVVAAACAVPLLVCGCGDKSGGDQAGDGKPDASQTAKLKAGLADRTTDTSKLTDAQKQEMAKYAHGAGAQSRNIGTRTPAPK